MAYMHRALLLISAILLSSAAGPMGAQAPADMTVYAVAYVDAIASGRGAMASALKPYRDTSRKESGSLRVDVLEQTGRPGHFVVIEAWRDQAALDAHATSAPVKQLHGALDPVRASGYDQRPYEPLSVAPAGATAGGRAVYVVTHVDIAGAAAQTEAPGMLRRLAEASRKEAGCIRFEVLQHAMRRNHYTVFEIWQSQAALDAHAAAVPTRQYRDTVQPMSGSPVDERLYTAID